ncbi:MAG: DNA-binding domain-containing protein [Bacteriovoracaceae bacterium]
MNMDLKKFQQTFISNILSKQFSTDLKSEIVPTGTLDSLEALKVYQTDYYFRLQEALGSQYETCWLVLGDDEFFRIGQEYIKHHPSQNKNLNFYGDQFPQFVPNSEYSFLSELAQFEKDFWVYFHQEKTEQTIDWKNIPQEQIGEMIFRTNYLLYAWDYKLHDLWKKRQEENTQLSLDEFEGEQYVVLSKEGTEMKIRQLKKSIYHFLSCLQEGQDFATALGNLNEDELENLTALDWKEIFVILSYEKK